MLTVARYIVELSEDTKFAKVEIFLSTNIMTHTIMETSETEKKDRCSFLENYGST